MNATAVPLPTKAVVNTAKPRDLRLVEALHAFLVSLVRAHGVPGLNIALARDGRIVWEGAYGYADARSGKPMTTETVFHSGSMGKTYTGVAIMQLLEKELLELEDPINEYLPFKVANPLGGPEITLRHLMTHTSGLGGDAAASVFVKSARSLAEVLEAAYSRPTQPFADGIPTWTQVAGLKRQYSNIGIATLGLIVERVNPERLPYSQYIQREIMDPLGMRYAQYPPAQTQEYVRQDIWQRMSTGYQTMGEVWIPSAPVVFEEFPAGGFVATPADHLRFVLAMMQGGQLNGVRILSAESVKRMLVPAVPGHIVDYGIELVRERQGLIWWLRDWDLPSRAFHHEGGHMFGWRTLSIAYPQFNTALVVASDRWSALGEYWTPEMQQIDGFIENWLKGEPPEVQPLNYASLAYKASYLRGMLFAESYRFIGVPESLTEEQARTIAAATVPTPNAVVDPMWDAEAFVSGVMDISALSRHPQAVREFAQSPAMRIPLSEAQHIFINLGGAGGTFATLGGLLGSYRSSEQMTRSKPQ